MMDSARSGNPIKLLSLTEAAQKLSVSVEVLLKWNEHNILKPTITLLGEIGYTQNQIDQFMAIRQLFKDSAEIKKPSTDSGIHETNGSISRLFHQDQQQNGWTKANLDVNDSHSKYINQNPLSGIEDTQRSDMKHDSETRNEMKQPLPMFMLLLSILLIFLASTVFLKPAMQISKLKLTSEIASALPVQLDTEQATHTNLENAGEDVISDKISALQLYDIENDKDYNLPYPTNIPDPQDNADRDKGFNFSRTLLSIVSDTNCPTCDQDETQVIDSSGYIKGEPKGETLAMIVNNVDNMLKNDSINPSNDDPAILMIFLSTGALAVLFMFYRQLSVYPAGRSTSIRLDRVQTYSEPRDEKVLEVVQKTDGSVVVNFYGQEYKISKPEMNSESDQFIERLMSLTPFTTKEIEYDVSRLEERSLSTPLSRLVTRLGFVGIKRDLFFPRTSKCSVLFRKYLTTREIEDMNLTKEQILKDLAGTN